MHGRKTLRLSASLRTLGLFVLVALAVGAVSAETGLGGYSSTGGDENGYAGAGDGGSSGGGYGGYEDESSDQRAPDLKVRSGAVQSRKRVIKRGLALSVKCSEACKVSAIVSVESRRGKGFARMRPGTVLGRAHATRATWWDKLPVKLRARGRKALKRSRVAVLKVTVTAVDAEGNRSAPVKRTIVVS